VSSRAHPGGGGMDPSGRGMGVPNRGTRLTLVVVATAAAALFAVLAATFTDHSAPPHRVTTDRYPVGVRDRLDPSGMAPPGPDALQGYSRTYVSDFPGSSLPTGWDPFAGVPGADPGGQFASSHVVVAGGVLHLDVFRDPAYGNKWVTGGVCLCGVSQTYGAVFVRSRIDAPGAAAAELLWPADNSFPPEIDFNETAGAVTWTSSTIHYSKVNALDQHNLTIDMRTWHTWGVIWSPTSIILTVDGREWASTDNRAEIPDLPMTLHLQEQTYLKQGSTCTFGTACPSVPSTMEVDWVAEYSPR